MRSVFSEPELHRKYHELLDAGKTRGLRQAYERWADIYNRIHPDRPIEIFPAGLYDPLPPKTIPKDKRNLCPVCWVPAREYFHKLDQKKPRKVKAEPIIQERLIEGDKLWDDDGEQRFLDKYLKAHMDQQKYEKHMEKDDNAYYGDF